MILIHCSIDDLQIEAIRTLRYQGALSGWHQWTIQLESRTAPNILYQNMPDEAVVWLENDEEPHAQQTILKGHLCAITCLTSLRDHVYVYECEIASPLWLLTLVEQSILFSGMSPQEIVTEICRATQSPLECFMVPDVPEVNSITAREVFAYQESRYDFLMRYITQLGWIAWETFSATGYRCYWMPSVSWISLGQIDKVPESSSMFDARTMVRAPRQSSYPSKSYLLNTAHVADAQQNTQAVVEQFSWVALGNQPTQWISTGLENADAQEIVSVWSSPPSSLLTEHVSSHTLSSHTSARIIETGDPNTSRTSKGSSLDTTHASMSISFHVLATAQNGSEADRWTRYTAESALKDQHILIAKGRGWVFPGDFCVHPASSTATSVSQEHSAGDHYLLAETAWSMEIGPNGSPYVTSWSARGYALEMPYRQTPWKPLLAGNLGGCLIRPRRSPDAKLNAVLDQEGAYQVSPPTFVRTPREQVWSSVPKIHRFHTLDHRMHVPFTSGSTVALVFDHDDLDVPWIAGGLPTEHLPSNTTHETAQHLYVRDHQGHALAFINEGLYHPGIQTQSQRNTATLIHTPAYDRQGRSALTRMGDSTHVETALIHAPIPEGLFRHMDGKWNQLHDAGHVILIGGRSGSRNDFHQSADTPDQERASPSVGFRQWIHTTPTREGYHFVESTHVDRYAHQIEVPKVMTTHLQSTGHLLRSVKANQIHKIHQAPLQERFDVNTRDQWSGHDSLRKYHRYEEQMTSQLAHHTTIGERIHWTYQGPHLRYAMHQETTLKADRAQRVIQQLHQTLDSHRQDIHHYSQKHQHIQSTSTLKEVSATHYHAMSGQRHAQGLLTVMPGAVQSHRAHPSGPHWFSFRYLDSTDAIIPNIPIQIFWDLGDKILKTQGSDGIYVQGLSATEALKVVVGDAEGLSRKIAALRQTLRNQLQEILKALQRSHSGHEASDLSKLNVLEVDPVQVSAIHHELASLALEAPTREIMNAFEKVVFSLSPQCSSHMVSVSKALSDTPFWFTWLLKSTPQILALPMKPRMIQVFEQQRRCFRELAQAQQELQLCQTFTHLKVNEHHQRYLQPGGLAFQIFQAWTPEWGIPSSRPKKPGRLKVRLHDQTISPTESIHQAAFGKYIQTFAVQVIPDHGNSVSLEMKDAEGVWTYLAEEEGSLSISLQSSEWFGQSIFIIGVNGEACELAQDEMSVPQTTWQKKVEQVDSEGLTTYVLSLMILPPALMLNFRQDAQSLDAEDQVRYEAMMPYFRADAQSVASPCAFDVLPEAWVAYAKSMGGNLTFFIHGYNVSWGEFAPKYRLIDEFSMSNMIRDPLGLMSIFGQNFLKADFTRKSGLYRNRTLMIDWFGDAYDSSMAHWVDALIDPQAEWEKHRDMSTAEFEYLNGTGAHAWLLAMEYHLNRGAGFQQNDYRGYSRVIGVGWQGDPYHALDYMAAVPMTEYPAKRLANMVEALKREGIRVNLLAHSLGSVVLARTLEYLSQKNIQVDHAFLWEPALPNTFLNPQRRLEFPMMLNENHRVTPWHRYQLAQAAGGAEKMTVLYSREDTVLGVLPKQDSFIWNLLLTLKDPGASGLAWVTLGSAVVQSWAEYVKGFNAGELNLYALAHRLGNPPSYFANASYEELKDYYDRWRHHYAGWMSLKGTVLPFAPTLEEQYIQIRASYSMSATLVQGVMTGDTSILREIDALCFPAAWLIFLILNTRKARYPRSSEEIYGVFALLGSQLLTPEAIPDSALGSVGFDAATWAKGGNRTWFETPQTRGGRALCFDHSAMKMPTKAFEQAIYRDYLMTGHQGGFQFFGRWLSG